MKRGVRLGIQNRCIVKYDERGALVDVVGLGVLGETDTPARAITIGAVIVPCSSVTVVTLVLWRWRFYGLASGHLSRSLI